MDEAEHCDRILLMREGRLLADGTPRGSAAAGRRRRPRGRVPAPGERAAAMSPRRTIATATRVLRQLRRDPRTIALLLVVPFGAAHAAEVPFDGRPETFDRLGGPMLGLFPFVAMFLVTSIAMLRERTSGTLERLMASPIAKGDLLCGYGLAFGAVAAVQALVIGAVAFGALGLDGAAPRNSCSSWPSPTPSWAWRWACSSAPSPRPSSRPSSSCRPSLLPSCCCADSCPARADGRGARRAGGRAAPDLRVRRPRPRVERAWLVEPG